MIEGEAELHALVQGLQDAWNHGDAARFAEPFADDAEVVHLLGGGGTGRPAVRAGMEALFRTVYARSHVEYRVEKIKRLAPGVAVVLLRQKLTFNQGGQTYEIWCRPTLVCLRAGGRWSVALFQNTKIAGETASGAEAALAETFPFPPGSFAGVQSRG
jgi:uncharacterized protein (TIGR02246 family)